MNEENAMQVIAKSKKAQGRVIFTINDEHLAQENYECVGCSNGDYGS